MDEPADIRPDRGVQVRRKKSIDAAGLTLAVSGAYTGRLRDFGIARYFNQAAGGAVLAPWDVQFLPLDWLDALTALVADYAPARENVARIERAKAKYFAGMKRH